MVKIMDFGIFGLDSSGIHPAALILICSISVVSGIAVFVFGFQKPEPKPERRKNVENNINQLKRKKRQSTGQSAVVGATLNNVSKSPSTQQQLSRQKVTKNSTVATKENNKQNNSVTSKNSSVPTKAPTTPKKNKSKTAKPINPNDGGDGEWQTVLSKKQKKHGDPLLQAVAKVAAKATKTSSKGAGLEMEQKRKNKSAAE